MHADLQAADPTESDNSSTGSTQAMASAGNGFLPSTLALQHVESYTIKARSPAPSHLISLAPTDIMLGAVGSIISVAIFWPNSPAHDLSVLIAGLRAALDGYPTFVGRLQEGGKVSTNTNVSTSRSTELVVSSDHPLPKSI